MSQYFRRLLTKGKKSRTGATDITSLSSSSKTAGIQSSDMPTQITPDSAVAEESPLHSITSNREANKDIKEIGERSQNNDSLIVEVEMDVDTEASFAPPSDLELAVKELQTNYHQFSEKHQQYYLIQNEFDITFENTKAEDDFTLSAQIFSRGIMVVLKAIEKRQTSVKTGWGSTLGHFLSKFFPVVSFSLGLTGAVVDGANFLPLKGVANGLGLILQVLDRDQERASQFHQRLSRIEYQAERLANNPKIDLNSDVTRSLHAKKSLLLLTAIIRYFNSTLLYFNSGFFVNLGKTILEGDVDEKWIGVEIAAKEYDQIILDLIHREISDLKATILAPEKQKEDREFRQWLAPSYISVKDQLFRVRQNRGRDTLHWAGDLEEFRQWRLEEGDNNRILWIRGPPGVGKSTMAGYYIDLLNLLYPKSIVLYFFCVRGVEGLAKPRDIIRTLAYQLCKADSGAYYVLENLKNEGFQINDNVGIPLIFDSLLSSVVRETKRDIYVVLDGLDEADKGPTDIQRSEIAEIDMTLQLLSSLKSTRTLCTSRPGIDIARILSPQPILKRVIDKTDNHHDIEIYISKALEMSDRLRRLFEMGNINPIEYFIDNANGVFLWVSITLHCLLKVKSRSEFQNNIQSFHKTSGSMDKLYADIMEQVDEGYKGWIREILRWVAMAERQLQVSELRTVVEWVLKDELADFQEFLEIDCGSMLQIVGGEGNVETRGVQLIHETFRSFLINVDKCSPDFHIDSERIHGHITINCLNYLATNNDPSHYIATFWTIHLAQATSVQQSPQLLASLHMLFTSDGLKRWIKYGLTKEIYIENEFVRVDKGTAKLEIKGASLELNRISGWIKQFSGMTSPIQTWQSEISADAIEWVHNIAENETCLAADVARAAINLWIGEIDEYPAMREEFLLALKYYRPRPLRQSIVLGPELQKLMETEFMDIRTLAEGEQNSLVAKNIGLAYYVLNNWDESIRCLRSASNNCENCMYMAWAYMGKQDYDGAIEMATKATLEFDQTERWPWGCLGEAYHAKGEHVMAISAIKREMDMLQSEEVDFFTLQRLVKSYQKCDNHVGAIKVLTRTLELYPEFASLWDDLVRSYHAIGDYDEAINTITRAIAATNNKFYCFSLPCHSADKTTYDFDGAIRILQEAVERFPTQSSCWEMLGRVYQYKGDKDGATQVFKRAMEKNPYKLWAMLCLAEAYTATGEYNQAIEILKKACERYPADPWPLEELGRVYHRKGDNDQVIQIFEQRLDKHPRPTPGCFRDLVQAYCAVGNLDGAIETSQKMIDDNPTWFDWQNLYGVLSLKGDHDRSVRVLCDAASKYPTERHAWEYLGKACEANGDGDGAVNAFTKATEIDSGDPILWTLLGKAYYQKKDYKTAIEILETVTKNYSERSDINETWMRLSEAYTASEMPDKGEHAKRMAEEVERRTKERLDEIKKNPSGSGKFRLSSIQRGRPIKLEKLAELLG